MHKVFFSYELQDKAVLKSVSASVEILLGYSVDDFTSGAVTFEELVHTDDLDLLEILLSSRDISQEVMSKNLRVRHKNEKIICVRISYKTSQLKNTEGQVIEFTLEDASLIKSKLDDQVVLSNFYAMMENTNDYIYFKDRNHTFTGASRTLVNITNPSIESTDLIGRTDYDVFSEQLADRYYELEKKIFNSDLEVVQEIQPTIDNKGNKSWVDNRKYPIKNNQGDIIGLFGIARDITRELNEKVDSETHHYTQSLIEASLDPFVTIAMDGTISDVNLATEEITGLTKKQLIGTEFSDYFTEPQRAIMAYLDVYQKGSIRDYFLEMKHKDGYVTPVMYNVSVYKDSAGNVAGVFAVARDISQQMETDEQLYNALKNSEISNKALKDELLLNQQINQKLKLINSIFESSNPIIITDKDGKISRVNKALMVLTGYEEFELLGESPALLQSGRLSKSFYENLWSELLENGCWSGEVTDCKKNGELFLAWLSISQIKDINGHVINYFAHLSDITQHKNTQSALVRRLCMEELLSEIAIKVLGSNDKNIHQSINDSLQLLGEELLADQCFLLEINDDGVMSRTHEWPLNRDKIAIDKAEPANNKLSCKNDFFKLNNVIKIDDIDDIDDIDENFVKLVISKLLAGEQEIKSLVLVPKVDNAGSCSCLVLVRLKNKRAWRKEDISLLKVAVNTFFIALYRNDIEKENKNLITNLISTQEQERRYLARELHDEMGQLLTAMHMDTSYLRTLKEVKNNEVAFQRLSALDDLSIQLISKLRVTTRRIRTATLDQLGLIPAIKELVTDWKMYNHTVDIELKLVEHIDPITEDIMLTFYRAIQEGLTNISKYAKATKVTVFLELLNRGKDKRLRLILSDDGVGMSTVEQHRKGSGLLGMKERVRVVEGEIKISPNQVGTGTCIEIEVPISQHKS